MNVFHMHTNKVLALQLSLKLMRCASLFSGMLCPTISYLPVLLMQHVKTFSRHNKSFELNMCSRAAHLLQKNVVGSPLGRIK